MGPQDIRSAYILYIGAGAVAAGGIISVLRALPTIWHALRSGLRDFSGARGVAATAQRTDRDISLKWVLVGVLGLLAAITLSTPLHMNLLGALMIVVFGFIFVTVSSRLTGEIGSSSNPISGMTVATLLLTCGLFVLLGWVGVGFKAMALTTAALVCVAASNGGTISQDLKTGHLVGATPKHQQVSILFGVVTSAIVIGFVLLLLNQSHTTFKAVDAPDYTATVAADAPTETGPDGESYRVHYVHEDEGAVLRGKYLVDDAGRLAFLVDPGVCGTYPYKLVEKEYPGAALPVPGDAGTELGTDRRSYRVVELAEPHHSGGVTVPTGRYLVNESGEVAYATEDMWKFDAPKAQLFRLIIDGTLGGKLPWGLVLAGVFLALILELLGISSLPFAVGLYLPIHTSAGIFVGGCVRWLVDRKRKNESSTDAEFSPGVLMASGLIAGGAIAGVVQAIIAYNEWESHLSVGDAVGEYAGDSSNPFMAFLAGWLGNHTWWPLVPFLAMAVGLYIVGTRSKNAR
jgi:hypothetical protein